MRSKKELEIVINKHWGFVVRFSVMCALVGVLIGYMISSIIYSPICTGIGGFVYQEIEWQDQTISIMEENCRNGLYIDDWTYSDKKELYCYTKECVGEYCKEGQWRAGVYTPK